jgi:hypothetical protein
VEGEAGSVADGVCPAAMAANANDIAAARKYLIDGSLLANDPRQGTPPLS